MKKNALWSLFCTLTLFVAACGSSAVDKEEDKLSKAGCSFKGDTELSCGTVTTRSDAEAKKKALDSYIQVLENEMEKASGDDLLSLKRKYYLATSVRSQLVSQLFRLN